MGNQIVPSPSSRLDRKFSRKKNKVAPVGGDLPRVIATVTVHQLDTSKNLAFVAGN